MKNISYRDDVWIFFLSSWKDIIRLDSLVYVRKIRCSLYRDGSSSPLTFREYSLSTRTLKIMLLFTTFKSMDFNLPAQNLLWQEVYFIEVCRSVTYVTSKQLRRLVQHAVNPHAKTVWRTFPSLLVSAWIAHLMSRLAWLARERTKKYFSKIRQE